MVHRDIGKERTPVHGHEVPVKFRLDGQMPKPLLLHILIDKRMALAVQDKMAQKSIQISPECRILLLSPQAPSPVKKFRRQLLVHGNSLLIDPVLTHRIVIK